MQQVNRTHSLDEPGLISGEELVRLLKEDGGGHEKRRRPLPEGQIRVEVEVDDAVFLSFEDSAKCRITAKLEPTEVKAIASMLLLAEDRQADSRCYVSGSVEVSHGTP